MGHRVSKVVNLDDIFDYVTSNYYDYYHGLGPKHLWVIDVEPFFDDLAEKLNVTEEELGKMFDDARQRVHGDKPE